MKAMMHAVDWLPTLVEAVGAPLLPSWNKLDGISQWPAISRGKQAEQRTSFLYGVHDHGEQRWKPYDIAFRDGDWKLIQGWGGSPDTYSGNDTTPRFDKTMNRSNFSKPTVAEFMLFNVDLDPSEQYECSVDHWDHVVDMNQKLNEIRASAVDVPGGGGHPDPNCPPYLPSYDPSVGLVIGPWC